MAKPSLPREGAPQPWSGHGEARRNSGHFTRGSQLLGHQYSMWWRGARLPLFVWLGLTAFFVWAKLTLILGNGELLMIGQRAIAWIWTQLGLSDQKQINITLHDGTIVKTYIGYVPYVAEVDVAWSKLIASIGGSLMFGAIGALLFAWWFVPWAKRRSEEMLKEHHERGAELAAREVLVAKILKFNRAKLQAIAARSFPDLTFSEALAQPFQQRKEAGLLPSYTVATVPYPLDREQNHLIAFGTTGSGKTTVLRDIIRQALERGNSCVVFDLTGAFVESFYDPRRDHILNLNDERCEHWSVFHDCAHDGEFLAAAEALIPDVDGADGGFWEKAARTIFVEMCSKLRAEGKGTNRHLIRALMTATLGEIYEKLKGTIADPLTNPKAERMANSVRGVFNAHAKALMFLPEDGKPFSIKEWAARSGDQPSILFVTSRYVDMPLNRSLLSMWMNIAIHGLMALPRTNHIRCWFFFDELGALHYLPAIEDGMQSARNYGGAFVLGVHSLASLRERYGEYGSTKIISLAYSKLILATGDRDTAEECSKLIGYRQVRTMDEAYSYGAHQTRDASTISPTRKEEALVFPDDITNLENLSGYIRFREGFPAAFVTMPWTDYPERAKGFLLRPPPARMDLVPDENDGDEDAGGRDAAASKIVEGEQLRLGLAEEAEAFEADKRDAADQDSRNEPATGPAATSADLFRTTKLDLIEVSATPVGTESRIGTSDPASRGTTLASSPTLALTPKSAKGSEDENQASRNAESRAGRAGTREGRLPGSLTREESGAGKLARRDAMDMSEEAPRHQHGADIDPDPSDEAEAGH